MHVQHTCNTRATHVQHDVQNDVQHQHEHFYCKITGKIALSRPLATNLLCFHLKAKVGLQQQETQLYLYIYRKSARVARRVDVCCTCVTLVLHVRRMEIHREINLAGSGLDDCRLLASTARLGPQAMCGGAASWVAGGSVDKVTSASRSCRSTTCHLPAHTRTSHCVVGGALTRSHLHAKIVGSTTWHLPELTGGHPISLQNTPRYLSIHPSFYLSIHLSVYLPICLFISFSIHISIYLSVCLSIHLSIYPSSCLSTYLLSIYLSIYLSFHLCLALYLSMQPSIDQTACLCVYLSIHLSFYFSLSRSIHFLVYLSVFPLVFRSIHLSSCLSAHPAVHSIHFSTETFHTSIYLVLHFS